MVKEEEKTYCSDCIVHITYGTYIVDKIYVHEIFSQLFSLNLFIQISYILVTEGEGSSENLPLLWIKYADLV